GAASNLPSAPTSTMMGCALTAGCSCANIPMERTRIAERTNADFIAFLMEGIIGQGKRIPQAVPSKGRLVRQILRGGSGQSPASGNHQITIQSDFEGSPFVEYEIVTRLKGRVR